MVDVFLNQFSYLKVEPALAQAVHHSDSYIKSVINGEKERNIFNNVSYDDEEKDKIRQVENLAQRNNVQHALFSHTGQILKFIYGNSMDPAQAYQNMIEHLSWEAGYIYIAGTDKQMRPTIVFDVGKIDLEKTTEESIVAAYSRIFKIVEEYYFFPSKIESWNVIIETCDIGAFNLPMKILGKIITTMQSNFPSSLNNIFLLNPSTSLNLTWKVIAAFISKKSNKKIAFLKKNEISKILDYYIPEQLEQRFGGTAPNVTKFYPPQKFQPNQEYLKKAAAIPGSMLSDSIEGSPMRYKEDNNLPYQQQRQYSTLQPSLYTAQPQALQQSYYRQSNVPVQSQYEQPIANYQRERRSSIISSNTENSRARTPKRPIFQDNNKQQYSPHLRPSTPNLYSTQQQQQPFSYSSYVPEQQQRMSNSTYTAPMKFNKQSPNQEAEVRVKPPEFRASIYTTPIQDLKPNTYTIPAYYDYKSSSNVDRQYQQPSYARDTQQTVFPQERDSTQPIDYKLTKEGSVIYKLNESNLGKPPLPKAAQPPAYMIVHSPNEENQSQAAMGIRDNEEVVKRSKKDPRVSSGGDVYAAYRSILPTEEEAIMDTKDLQKLKYSACNIF